MSQSKILKVVACAAAVFAGSAIPLASPAEAVVVCRGRIAGEGTGSGLFGLANTNARQNAVTDWTNRAGARHGAGFSNISRARGVTYDCRQGAIFQSKCVVTGAPCGEDSAGAPGEPSCWRRESRLR